MPKAGVIALGSVIARRSAHAAGVLATGRQGRRARPDPRTGLLSRTRTGVLGEVEGRVALLATRSGGLRPVLDVACARRWIAVATGCPDPSLDEGAAPRVGDDLLVVARRLGGPKAGERRSRSRASFGGRRERCRSTSCALSSPRVTCKVSSCAATLGGARRRGKR